MSVTHTFVSAKPAAADPTQVGSAEWNAEHTVSIVNADIAAAAAIEGSKIIPASAGVTGALTGTDWSTFNAKQAALIFPLGANLGGTGIANAAGSTLTLGAATSITGGGTVALGGFTLTVPATGTAALLATANVFTTQQMVDGTSDQVQLRVQAHSTQTASMQTWESSAGTVRAEILGDGRILQNLSTTLTSGNYVGYLNETTVTPASSSSLQVEGMRFQQNLSGTQNFTGSYWSVVSLPVVKTTGTVTELVGFLARNTQESTVATLTNSYGFRTRFENYVGTTSNAFHFRANDFSTQSGTVNSQYGFFTDDLTKATANYAIYTNKGAVSLLGSDTKASAAGAAWKGIELRAATAIITGSTNITTATGFNYFHVAQPTLSAASALTVTNSATFYIANSPLGGGAGPATITNMYALWVDAGISRFDGNGTHIFELPADATGNATAATGRIPVKIGGATKYLRYYDD